MQSIVVGCDQLRTADMLQLLAQRPIKLGSKGSGEQLRKICRIISSRIPIGVETNE